MSRRATDADIAELRDKLAQTMAVMKNKEKYIHADLSFHLALAKASHNDVLSRFLYELRPLMRAWIRQTTRLYNLQQHKIQMDRHVKILEAIEQKDGEKAKSIMCQHLDKVFLTMTPRLIDWQMKAYAGSMK